MVSFVVYDLIFLALFVIVVSLFLYKGRKNLSKDGWLLLYRTKWGMKQIDNIGDKHPKIFRGFSYVSIIMGYILMAASLYLVWNVFKVYLFQPEVVKAIKVPPITPLIPYLPEIFNISFLPPLYVTYWIIMIAIVAVPHEFFHGIFMRHYGIKIKSTGFGFFPYFLPVFLAAFVEQDEKSMEKSKNFNQMAVLSAGTFANVLTAILFFFIFWLFFSLAFAQGGIVFEDYSYSIVKVSAVSMINGVALNNPTSDELSAYVIKNGTNIVSALEKNHVGIKGFAKINGEEYVALYDDAPAINAKLNRVITEIDGKKITNVDELTSELSKYSPGDEIEVKSINSKMEESTTNIVLGEKDGRAFMGIYFSESPTGRGIMGKIYTMASSFKNPNVYYAPKVDGLSIFVYNLLIWILLASISVAIVNMLPVGIFDGGRFFYLTVLSLTGNEKFAKRAFSFMTSLFLFLLFVLMVLWVYSMFM